MSDPFKFELISPQRVLLSEDVTELLVPGSEGEFTVLAGHAPVVTVLRPGVLAAKLADGATQRIYARSGFVQVEPDHVTVLVDQALDLADAEPARVGAELEAAERELAEAADDASRTAATAAVASLRSLQGARAG